MSNPVRIDDLQFQASQVQAALLGQITEKRKELGLAQGELAERVGVSRMTVQRAETEGADPKLSSFIELAMGLNLQLRLSSEGAEDGVAPFADTIIHRGYHHNRTKLELTWRDRQREAALAKSWEAVNEPRSVGLTPILPSLLPGHTQDQASAVATAVQWLGSEVGFDFLQRALGLAGYEIVEKKK